MSKLNNGYGAQALDINQLIDLHGGTGIVSGCSASVGANAMEVDVASGTGRVNGTNYSIAATTVVLDAANADYPRKDLVVVDNTGSVTKITGTAETAKPAGATRRNTYQPKPEDTSGSDVAVIAEVWVGVDASDITSGDISDRRLFAQAGFEDADGDGIAVLQGDHADFQGGDARDVGAFDSESVSTGEVSIERSGVISSAPASRNATGGSGTFNDPYAGGVQTTLTNISNDIARQPGAVVLDGAFTDNVDITTDGKTLLGFENWHTLLEADSGDVVDVNATDAVLRNLWIRANNKTANVIHASSANGASEELYLNNVEVESGDVGIKIDGTEYVRMDSVHCQTPGSYGIQVTGDTRYMNLSNISSEGTVQLGGTDNGQDSSVTGLIIVSPSGKGLDLQGYRIHVTGLTVKSPGGTGISVNSDYNTVVGSVNGGAADGVVFGETNNATGSMFFGASVGNTGADLVFEGGTTAAVECMAFGSFGSVTNNGTRCLVNGHGVNNGAPGTDGQWNTYAGLAYRLGATIWDTSTAPETPYKATPSGSWVSI